MSDLRFRRKAQTLARKKHTLGAFGTMIMMAACGGGGSTSPQTSAPVAGGGGGGTDTPPPVAKFTDVTETSGIAYENGFRQPLALWDLDVVATAGAAAAGDYDADGDVDVFIVRGDIGPNLLYRNIGDLVFEEVAEAAGVAYTRSPTENYRHAGTMFADIDGDGDLDLFIGGIEGDPCLIFANNGDGTFTDVSQGSGIEAIGQGNSIGAAFGDFDLDGDLDLFVSHWLTERDFENPGDTQHLWRNDSDQNAIRFTSVSESAGISPTIINLPDPNTILQYWDFTFAPSFARINDDLYPDILSVADFNFTQFFVNNQDGTFSNATDTDVLIDENGMGSAIGDYDNDGDLDWFVSSILFHGEDPKFGNRLYRNDNGAFADVTDEAGVADGGWGWAACFIDVENDGDLDIYHTNGWPFTDADNDFTVDKSRLFVSDGNGKFEESAEEFGLADTDEGRGAVCADFDNDGDIDILQLIYQGANLWRNETSGNNFLGVTLQGVAPNTGAAGSRIFITAGGTTQMREVSIASNFASQNPRQQIFGMGSSSMAAELRVEWHDGRETVMTNVSAGQKLTIQYPVD